MRKETAEKCKFIAGLFFFGGKKADIIRSSNESRPKLRNEIKQQDKKIKSEDERMKKKVAAIFMASIMACSMAEAAAEVQIPERQILRIRVPHPVQQRTEAEKWKKSS